MKVIDTYFLKAKEGKRLIQDGKDFGAAVWLGINKSADGFENVATKELRQVIVPDDGKVLRNKATGEYADSHWLRDDNMEDWEDAARPEENINE